jgi:hypothetical protein
VHVKGGEMRRQGYQNFIIPHSGIRLVLLERPGRASAELPSENAGSVSFNCGARFHRIFFFFQFSCVYSSCSLNALNWPPSTRLHWAEMCRWIEGHEDASGSPPFFSCKWPTGRGFRILCQCVYVRYTISAVLIVSACRLIPLKVSIT